MAGMFYSLQETAERLNKSEEEIKELVKQGKLREFRDRSNLLFKVDEVEALVVDEGVPIKVEGMDQPTPLPSEQPSEPEQLIELEQPAEPVGSTDTGDAMPAEAEEPEQAQEPEQPIEDEILLAPESGITPAESGLTEADTAITSEGISVLGETDKGYQITDDTLSETVALGGTRGTTGPAPEVPLEEIEEDVNLDTFGSGSGLLDLSLQADDTSLGGILDEIYTAEGEGAEPAGPGTAAELTAEAEQILPGDDLEVPQAALEAPIMAQPYAEAQPDTQSNTLGYLLFLPLVMLLYTAVVAALGQRGVMPSILASMQGVIWYIVIAAIVVAALVVGAAFMLTGDLGKSAKKPAKPKKPKKTKAKKAPEQAPS